MLRSLENALDNGVETHDIAQLMDLAAGSVINQMLFGYRFSDVSSLPQDKCHVFGICEFRVGKQSSLS